MELDTSLDTRWTSRGLLGLLRATLPSASNASAEAVARDPELPPRPLDHMQLFELAGEWRQRAAHGDAGAESVAAMLELVARRRSQSRRARIEAVGQRLSNLMQLN